MTNFAALLDLSGREDNSLAKSVTTCFFCGLSLVALVFNILLLRNRKFESLFRKRFFRANQSKRSEMTRHVVRARDSLALHHSLALFAFNFFVLFLLERTEHALLCQISSMLLLWSSLMVFAFSSLHALLLLQMALFVFSSPPKLRPLLLFGYLFPVLVSAVGLAASLPSVDFSLERALTGNRFL